MSLSRGRRRLGADAGQPADEILRFIEQRSRLVAKTRTYNEDIRIRHTSKMDVSKLLIFGNS